MLQDRRLNKKSRELNAHGFDLMSITVADAQLHSLNLSGNFLFVVDGFR